MRVRDLLRKKQQEVVTIGAREHVTTAAQLLMRHAIAALPVTSAEGMVIGLLSERDIVRAVDRNSEGIRHCTAEQIMRRPAPACSAGDSLHDVMARMTHERMRHFVVMEEGNFAGVISVGDIVKERLDEIETERGVLRDYVAAQRATASPAPGRP
jgi:CBS domain-containing protein